MRFLGVFILLFFFKTGVFAVAIPGDTVINIKPDTSNKLIINEVVVAGNKVTKRAIIDRELSFTLNKALDKAQLEEQIAQSKNNLTNTGLFNLVKIDYVKDEYNYIKIFVLVTERWYTWPFPILQIADRNFNTWWLTKDLTRINYGMILVRANFRGRKETVVFRGQLGFTKQLGFAYNIPFIDKKQRNGLSFSANYSENNQVIIHTKNNKTEFYRDLKGNIRNEINASATYSHHRGFYDYHSFLVRYNFVSVADTVLKINPIYLSQFGKDRIQYFTLDYIFKYDRRDYRGYPLKGHYFELEAVKHGLGIFERQGSADVFYITGNVRKYWKLADRWHYAASAKFKVSSTSYQPFYFVRGLGYTDYVRGFEYYNFDGQSYSLVKNNLKFTIAKPKILRLWGEENTQFNTMYYAFYLNLFADAGRVYDRQTINENLKSKQYLGCVGLGLDWIGNYDRVLRFEMAYNSFKQLGFYIHLSSPI